MAKKKQFKIQAADLKKVMDKVGLAVSSNPAIPITKNILVQITSLTTGYITGTDLEMQIGHDIDVESEIEEAECLIPFELLNKIIALNKGALMTFVFEGKGLSIKTDTDDYKINVLEKVQDFIKPMESPKENIEKTLPDLTDDLKRALKTVNRDQNPAQPATLRVLLDIKKDGITIASTDTHYEVFSITKPAKLKSEVELLLPIKVIKAIDGLEDFTVSWDDKKVAINAPEVTIIFTRPEEKFVNFGAIFPPEFTANLKFDKKEMLLAMEKCALSKDRFKEAALDLKTGVITANDINSGIKINVQMASIEYSGDVSEIHFNADKMSNLLNQVPYNDMTLAIHQKDRPILFRSEEEPGYLALLMPIAF